MISTTLPHGWQKVRIKDIAEVTRGASPRPIASDRWFDDSSQVGWVRISDIGRSDGLLLTATTQRLSADGIARSRFLPPGTLIMSIAATVGLPIVTGIPACIHDGFVALQRLRGVDQHYLFYALKAQEGALRAAGQTGSQANVNTQIVNRLAIPLPPALEQRRIAESLHDADQTIIRLQRLLAKRESMRQGLSQELLTGRTRLPGFTGTWSTQKLGQLGSFLKGRGIKREDVQSTGISCIRYGELYTTYSGYTSTTVSFVSSLVAATALPLRHGDLLFAASGETRHEIGTCVAFTGSQQCVAGGDIVVLRAPTVNPIYLASMVNAPWVVVQKARLGQGDAVVHIGSRALGSIDSQIPDREEQDAIAKVLVDANEQIQRVKARLAKARAVKAGMLQQLIGAPSRAVIAEGS